MGGRGASAYMFLLCEAWLQDPTGSLPNEEAALIEMARVSKEEWEQFWPVLQKKFPENGDGRLYSMELKAEAKARESKKRAGASGWTITRRKGQAERAKTAKRK